MSHRGIFSKTNLSLSPHKNPSILSLTRPYHARTELGFRDSGGGQILHPPSVQFNLYQGEVLPYNPGTRDWVESTHSTALRDP